MLRVLGKPGLRGWVIGEKDMGVLNSWILSEKEVRISESRVLQR